MSADQLRLPVTEEWRVGRRKITNASREELRRAYLEALREEMRKLYRQRRMDPDVEEAAVCADDAREIFESWNPPSPENLSRNFLAGVWLPDCWQVVGRTRSNTPNSHGNEIKLYRYVGGTR